MLLVLSPVLAAKERIWMERGFASTRCVDAGATVERFREAREGRCLQLWTRLHVLGGLSLSRARYSTPAEPGNPSSPMLVTEVLFEEKNSTGRVRPLWMTRTVAGEEDIQRVVPYQYRGWRLVELLRCANGTGGCSQELVVWRPGNRVDAIAPLRASFEANLPPGYTARKPPMFNFGRLEVEGYGWSASDSNSAPSVRMVCYARFNGTVLSLSGCTRDSVRQ